MPGNIKGKSKNFMRLQTSFLLKIASQITLSSDNTKMVRGHNSIILIKTILSNNNEEKQIGQ